MKNDFVFPEPVERQEVTEKTVHPDSLPRKARSNKFNRGSWSFRLKEDEDKEDKDEDDKGYAYWGQWCYPFKIQYYHQLTIEDPELLEMLDYWDRQEEKSNRFHQENASYATANYEMALDEDGSALDPADRETYLEWVRDTEDDSGHHKLPVKAEKEIIHSIVEKLTPMDQRVYQYMFDEDWTEAEIKEAFNLTHSAWSEEKRRFLEKVRSVFIELGYEVLTLEEVRREASERRKKMKAIDDARQDEAAIGRLGKSLSEELRRIESADKPRAFAVEEQEKKDQLDGIDDLDELFGEKQSGDQESAEDDDEE